MILSVTNRCEFDVNVSFSPLCLEVTESTSGETAGFVLVNSFRSNSTISFGVSENTASLTTTTIKIDRQDNAKSQGPAALTPADIESSLGLLVLRRDNKIAITTRIRINNPDKVSGTGENVRCAFEMKFSNANVSSSAATGGSFPATSTPYLPGSESSSSTNTPSSPPTSNVTATATPLATPSIISSAAASPVTSTAQASASAQVVKIFLDLGPINLKDGFKAVPISKYIDDCLAVTDKKYAL